MREVYRQYKNKHRMPEYSEYLSLSDRERKNLVATNWFRMKHKLPLIEVPPYDKDYHKQFAKILKEKK